MLSNVSGSTALILATASKEITVPADRPFFGDGSFYLYIGTGGDLKCKLENDDAYSTFVNIPDGVVFFGKVKEISEDSTVSDLIIIG